MPDQNFQVFNGGINNFVQPHLLEQNQSVDLLDADVTDGAISSFNSTRITDTNNPFLTNQNSNGTRSLIRWDNQFYFSDNETQELNSTLGFMGIDPPLGIPSLNAINIGNLFSGEFKYTVTFLTDDGFESSPFQPDDLTQTANIQTRIENTIMVTADFPEFSRWHIFRADSNGNHYGYHAGEKVTYQGRNWEARVDVRTTRRFPLPPENFPGVNLALWRDVTEIQITATGFDRIIVSNLPTSTLSAVTKLNIYRTIADGSTYFLLATIEKDTNTYEDSTSDQSLLLNKQLNLSQLNFPPIFRSITGTFRRVGGRFLTEVDGVFFLANDDRVYFSRQSDPHSWDPNNFVKFDDVITAIAKEEDGVLVFTENRTYQLLRHDSSNDY